MNALRSLIAASLLITSSAVLAGKTITLHGKVETLDGGPRRTVVVIERENGATDSLVVGAGGSFRVVVVENSRVQLTFKQAGYITKVVDIDAEHAFPKFKEENERKVKFDVQLLPQSPSNDLGFLAPVGHIRFVKGSGLMKVHYDHNLVVLPQEPGPVASR